MSGARVLCLSDLWVPFPGGAERLMFNIARHLMHSGADVFVLTGYEAAQRFDGPPISAGELGVGPTHDHGAATIRSAIETLRPDVILTHHLYAYEFEAELAASGVPVVQVVLNTRRLDGAALAVFISEHVRALAGGRDGDMVITPPAFDDVVADRHGDAIGFVKPIPHKGVALLYAIAASMPERRFVVLRGEWQDLEVIRPAANIEFMEPVDAIREFYAECRLLLVPSLSEDAGTVAQEATLNGLPCISTDAGGLAETNGGGVLMPVVDRQAARRWVAAIRKLDNAGNYAAVVERQRAHLAAQRHADKLDALSDRIAEIGASWTRS